MVNNSIRIGGLASGMDTESMIKQMMKTERLKMDRWTQRKTYRTWQQEAYRETNKTMANYVLDARKKIGLDTDYFGNVRPDAKDKLTWLKSATSSNENAVSVQATATAMTGSYSVEVLQLATSAATSSSGDTGFSAVTKLSEAMGVSDTDTVMLTVNGKSLEFTGASNLREVAKKIQQETGVHANFDAGSKRMFLSTANTGSEAKIEFGSDAQTKNFLSAMKIDTNVLTVTGKNAQIKVNGGSVIEYQSNHIQFNGLDMTLKAKTSGTESINVSLDSEGAYKKVKEFIDDYNKLIDALSKKLGEKRHRDYQPLTTEQKEAMKEADIKLWEEKAKSGLLSKDETVSRILQDVRSGMYEKVAGGGAIYEMGITTGSYKDGGKLKIDEKKFKEALAKDADKVMTTLFGASELTKKEILKTDSADVRAEKLNNNKQRHSENGIFVRAFDQIMDGMEKVIAKAGPGDDSTLLRSVKGTILQNYTTTLGSRNEIDSNIFEISKRIDHENRRLSFLESKYWKQFTAMEKAMQEMQSQSGWLAQQFGGMK